MDDKQETRSVRRKSACQEHRMCTKPLEGRKRVLGKARKSLDHYAKSVLKAGKPYKPSWPWPLFITTAL